MLKKKKGMVVQLNPGDQKKKYKSISKKWLRKIVEPIWDLSNDIYEKVNNENITPPNNILQFIQLIIWVIHYIKIK